MSKYVAKLHPTLLALLHKGYEWKGKAVYYLDSHSSIRSMPAFKFPAAHQPNPDTHYFVVLSPELRITLSLDEEMDGNVYTSGKGKTLDEALEDLTKDAVKDGDYGTKTVLYLYPLEGPPKQPERVKTIAALVLPYRRCIKTSGATTCIVEPEDDAAQIIQGSSRSQTGAHGENGYVIIARPNTKVLVRQERVSGTGRLSVSTQVLQL
jgi:hypothetical protein